LDFVDLIKSFQGTKVLVIGDLMLDSYFIGSVDRISPEAPVPVVNLSHREFRLGGAGNVALNIKALGGVPYLCSVIGNDLSGGKLLELLSGEGISQEGILTCEDKPTTQKTRVIGNHVQMLRIDEENSSNLSEKYYSQLLSLIANMIEKHAPEVIIFEDYDKGTISSELIKNVISIAELKNIPVSVDPKKRNFLNYRDVSLFKPNLKELKEGLGVEVNLTDKNSIREAIALLRKKMPHQISMLTLSEKGMYICSDSAECFVDAHIRNISDVSGAGDTVVAIASLCLSKKADLETIARLSNLGGGMACEYPGVVAIHASDLITESIKKMPGIRN
jgi:rfaE bifunctional protein kinase chain/domain